MTPDSEALLAKCRRVLADCVEQMEATFANIHRLTDSINAMNAYCMTMQEARDTINNIACDVWRPIETARKDRTTIWAVFHPSIYPTLEPERPDLAPWNGLQLPLRHSGVEDDGFDIGWSIAAPVGQGGFPDRWIVGWRSLPAQITRLATPHDRSV